MESSHPAHAHAYTPTRPSPLSPLTPASPAVVTSIKRRLKRPPPISCTTSGSFGDEAAELALSQPRPSSHLEAVRCLSPLSVNSLSPNTPTAGGSAAKAKAPPSSGGRRGRRRGPEMSEVLPGLWIGSHAAAASVQTLAAQGISHVLNCTNQPGAHGADAAVSGTRYLSLGLLDSTADLPHMPAALQAGVRFIDEAIRADGRVLVHCHRGISRSVTLVIAYMIWAHRLTAEAAFVQVRRARRVADPNLGYWVSLKEWERQVLEPEGADEAPSAADGDHECRRGDERSV